MAYYYFKSGGTATGDAGRSATKRTGSFASMGVSAYYDNLYDIYGGAVPSTAPVPGDSALGSDVHDHTYTVTTIIGVVTGTYVYSVSDSNAGVYSRGAWERQTTGGDLSLTGTFVAGALSFKGISFSSTGQIVLAVYSPPQTIAIEDCEL